MYAAIRSSRTIPGTPQLGAAFAAVVLVAGVVFALAFGPLIGSNNAIAPLAAAAPVVHDRGWSTAPVTAPVLHDRGWSSDQSNGSAGTNGADSESGGAGGSTRGRLAQ